MPGSWLIKVLSSLFSLGKGFIPLAIPDSPLLFVNLSYWGTQCSSLGLGIA